jgi:hypothetical protein
MTIHRVPRSKPATARQLALCAALIAIACSCAVPTRDVAQSTQGSRVVAALPLSVAGVSYADVGREDHEAWGPSALRAADDGTFWIADAAADRLVHLDAQGKPLNGLSLAGHVVGARDVLVRDADLFVLDGSAMWPHVVRYSLDGALLEDVALPGAPESVIDGFLPSPDDRVLLHAGGVAVYELEKGAIAAEPHAFALGDRRFALEFADAESNDEIGHTLDIDTGRGTAHIELEHFVSSVRLLRAMPNGDSFFSLEEVAFEPKVLVDATVLHLDPGGNVLGRARVPVADQFVFVEHAVSVDPNGRLFALHTLESGAELVEVAWHDVLEPVLDQRAALAWQAQPDDAEEGSAGRGALPLLEQNGDVGATALALEAGACRTTKAMESKGFEYVNSATWLSKKNMDRANTRCEGRGVPRYFSEAKTTPKANRDAVCSGDSPGTGYECIRSVPYDWGGADTVASYQKAMGKNLQSGDIDTKLPVAENAGNTGIESCSHGTDCSGFVTRAWDIPSYYSGVSRATTKSLAKYSTSISDGKKSHPGCMPGKQMKNADPVQRAEITAGCKNASVKIQLGDILLKAGSHVTMFRKFGTASDLNVDSVKIDGKYPFHFEATESRSYDRVSYDHWPWSRFDSFEPRRFSQVCK